MNTKTSISVRTDVKKVNSFLGESNLTREGCSKFKFVDELLNGNQSNELGHNFPLVQFVMLYKVVLTSESVDEILKCDH